MKTATSFSVPVREEELALGTWQSIPLIECDWPPRADAHGDDHAGESVATPALFRQSGGDVGSDGTGISVAAGARRPTCPDEG